MGENTGGMTGGSGSGGQSGRTPILAANWKMHHTVAEARRFAEEFVATIAADDSCDIVICPPYTSLPALSERLAGSGVALGAQDVHWEEAGAFTGEISAAMLADVGCKYVIVGHSERRTLFGESDADVRRKVAAVFAHDMIPILCVGETADERESGETARVITSQIESAIEATSPEDVGRLVVAYEPVWAIGTGATATAEDANETISAIRSAIRGAKGEEAAASVRVQYGGSVKPSNIRSFAGQSEIDGALVGGASLEAATFAEIVNGWRG